MIAPLVRAPILRSLSLTALVPALVWAGTFPDLGGTWVGTAQKTLCNQPAGSANIELNLTDWGRHSGGGLLLPAESQAEHDGKLGTVVGTLTINGVQGKFIGLFDGNLRHLRSEQSPCGISVSGHAQSCSVIVSKDKPPVELAPLTGYNVDLTAALPWNGIGYYQTLSGRIWTQSFCASPSGPRIEELTVTLKKR